jgi:glutamyl-tRNA reductase
VTAKHLAPICELVILSTCHRTELYAVAETATPARLFDLWSALTGIPSTALQANAWSAEEQDCIRHLFRVSSGLESQVIGEPQILGQVVNAYEIAHEQGAAGTTLSALFQAAIRTGKRARAETELGYGSVSISGVAATYANKLLADRQPLTVLVIGAGEMAEQTITALAHSLEMRLWVTNRTPDHAIQLATRYGGQAIPLTLLGDSLLSADLVVTAVNSPQPILYAADLSTLLPQRTERPLVMIDIAFPRNIDPAVGRLPGVTVINLDDLREITDAHHATRHAAIPAALQRVEEEVSRFQQWEAGRAVVPTIQRLRGKAETIRTAEVDQLLSRLPDLDDRSRQLIEEFSQRLVNKLLHHPTLTLKEKSGADERDLYRTVLQDLFNLGEERAS